jgi:hypothetical protein
MGDVDDGSFYLERTAFVTGETLHVDWFKPQATDSSEPELDNSIIALKITDAEGGKSHKPSFSVGVRLMSTDLRT